MIEIVQAVQLVEKTWVPDDLKRLYTFFSASDLWHYVGVSDDKLCDYCGINDGMDLAGDVLRGKFPDLEIVDANTIYPHVHRHLVRQGIFGVWSKDSCRCVLIRVHEPINEAETA